MHGKRGHCRASPRHRESSRKEASRIPRLSELTTSQHLRRSAAWATEKTVDTCTSLPPRDAACPRRSPSCDRAGAGGPSSRWPSAHGLREDERKGLRALETASRGVVPLEPGVGQTRRLWTFLRVLNDCAAHRSSGCPTVSKDALSELQFRRR